MTSLVTVERYQQVTGDSTTDETLVQERLDRAQRKVEEYLRRPLASEERTERVMLRYRPGGVLSGAYAAYPKVTPVTDVADGLTIDGSAVLGLSGTWLSWWEESEQWAELVYTGGWTAETLPETIAENIIRLAHAAGNPALVPAGATSVSVGDASVSFDGSTGGSLPAPIAGDLRPWRRVRKQ